MHSDFESRSSKKFPITQPNRFFVIWIFKAHKKYEEDKFIYSIELSEFEKKEQRESLLSI